MPQFAVLDRKCTGCRQCEPACPFQAIGVTDGKAVLTAGCRMCGLCVKACPDRAIIKLETKAADVNKAEWQGYLVIAEAAGANLHPVSAELVGKALELANGRAKVGAVIIGYRINEAAGALARYGADTLYTYDDEAFSFFRADVFCAAAEDLIRRIKPSVVLIGATSAGRSLAPRLATRFHTGLTADCTRLDIRDNSDLVQIRPAFGGNIMAQIITSFTRPQFATVRFRVMDAPRKGEHPDSILVPMKTPKAAKDSAIRFIESRPFPKAANISEADIIVAGGRGIKKEGDLALIKELAFLLNGEYAVTRPLVEKGWESNQRQIGLSGRTVKPRLIIACGISGAVQFTACMDQSDLIIAINSDPAAQIFNTAHIGITGDLYQIIPELIGMIRGGLNP